MRSFVAIVAILGCSLVSATPPESAASRFSGSVTLTEPKAESTDQRFAIDAKLQANQTQSSGRFALKSHLVPNATDGSAFCGPRPNEVFSDGFEGI